MPRKKRLKFTAEVVNGKCPTCEEFTALVAIERDFFRCMNCGADLEQHVNGKIIYLKHVSALKYTKFRIRHQCH